MKAQLRQWAEKFDALSLRERVMVAAAVVVAVVLLGFEFIDTVQGKQNAALQNQISTLRTQIDASNQQITALASALSQDPDQANKQRLQELQQRLTQLDEQMQQKMASLISPAQMTRVLESVLTRQTDLKLERIQNLPTRPLLELAADETGKQPEAGVYRHGLQIVFSGSYLSTLEYLKALQALEWDFYWDELQLQVEAYPTSQIVITVHTISLKEGWIGV